VYDLPVVLRLDDRRLDEESRAVELLPAVDDRATDFLMVSIAAIITSTAAH